MNEKENENVESQVTDRIAEILLDRLDETIVERDEAENDMVELEEINSNLMKTVSCTPKVIEILNGVVGVVVKATKTGARDRKKHAKDLLKKIEDHLLESGFQKIEKKECKKC